MSKTRGTWLAAVRIWSMMMKMTNTHDRTYPSPPSGTEEVAFQLTSLLMSVLGPTLIVLDVIAPILLIGLFLYCLLIRPKYSGGTCMSNVDLDSETVLLISVFWLVSFIDKFWAWHETFSGSCNTTSSSCICCDNCMIYSKYCHGVLHFLVLLHIKISHIVYTGKMFSLENPSMFSFFILIYSVEVRIQICWANKDRFCSDSSASFAWNTNHSYTFLQSTIHRPKNHGAEEQIFLLFGSGRNINMLPSPIRTPLASISNANFHICSSSVNLSVVVLCVSYLSQLLHVHEFEEVLKDPTLPDYLKGAAIYSISRGRTPALPKLGLNTEQHTDTDVLVNL